MGPTKRTPGCTGRADRRRPSPRGWATDVDQCRHRAGAVPQPAAPPPRTAEPVGQRAADRPDERTEQRAEEGQGSGLYEAAEVGLELDLEHLAEGEAEPDERSEVPM